MKAKRILAVILAAISLAGYGCSDRIELSREAVDSKFVPGHMAGTVMYVKSGNVLVPIDTRHHVDDAWKIQYRICPNSSFSSLAAPQAEHCLRQSGESSDL